MSITNRGFWTAALLVGVAVCLAGVSFGQSITVPGTVRTKYVRTTASGGGSGDTWASAYTIDEAQAFSAYTTSTYTGYVIAEGTHNLGSQINVTTGTVWMGGFPEQATTPTLLSQDPWGNATTITRTAGRIVSAYDKEDITLDGLRFAGTSNTGGLYGGAVSFMYSEGSVVQNCVFAHNTLDLVGTTSGYKGGAGLGVQAYPVLNTFTIRNCRFYDNVTIGNAATDAGHWGNGYGGGALYIYKLKGGGGLMENCEFRGNSFYCAANVAGSVPADKQDDSGRYQGGGAVFIYDSAMEITGCTFYDNAVYGDGADYNYANWCQGGGAMTLHNSPAPANTISECTFTSNTFYMDTGIGSSNGMGCGGGALHMFYRSDLAVGNKVLNCNFYDNTFVGHAVSDGSQANVGRNTGGGGIMVYNHNPVIDGCNFHGNTAVMAGWDTTPNNCGNSQGGAAIYLWVAPTGTEINNCTITGNMCVGPHTAYWSGAALYLNHGNTSATITNTHIDGNDCYVNSNGNQGGGGIHMFYASATFTSCTISGNQTLGVVNGVGDGGGMMLAGADCDAKFVNCVISGNSAERFGGAVFTRYNGQAEFVNCSFARNEAGNAATDGIYVTGDQNWTLLLTNCLFYDMFVGMTMGDPGHPGGTLVWDNCLFEDNDNYDLTRSTRTGTGAIIGEPLLAMSEQATLGQWATVTTSSAVTTLTATSSSVFKGRDLVGELIQPDRNNLVLMTSILSHTDDTVVLGGPWEVEGESFVLADHRLTSGSAAMDAGLDLGSALTEDIEGSARPTDGDLDSMAAFDIGAYEYVPKPAIAAVPDSLNFGQVHVAAGSKQLSLELRNVGELNLTFNNPGIYINPSSAFTLSDVPSTATAWASGASNAMKVDFDPWAAGTYHEVIQVYTNDPDKPVLNIPLTGEGIWPPAATREWELYDR